MEKQESMPLKVEPTLRVCNVSKFLSIMACANHVCGEQHATIACPLCQTVAYCSEACRVIDWVKHDCANVIRVSSPNDAPFLPYFFEDRMSDAELGPTLAPGATSASPIGQSHVALYFGPNQTRVEYPIPARIEATDSQSGWRADFVTPTIGGNPETFGLGLQKYRIRISLLDDTLEGNVLPGKQMDYNGSFLDNTVYKGNTDERVDKLLKNKGWTTPKDPIFKRGVDALRRGLTKLTHLTNSVLDNLLFWPEITASTALQLPATGNLRVEFYVGNVLVTHIRGGFNLKESAAMSKLSAVAQAAFQIRLKSKFSPALAIGMFPFQAKANDVIATITMKIAKGGDSGSLRDIEFVVPETLIHDAINQSVRKTSDPIKSIAMTEYRCNPRVAEELIGLVCAVETASVHNKQIAEDESLQNNSGILRKYARNIQDKLNCSAPADVPMEVNTAVRYVTHALYDYNVAGKKE